VAEVLKWIVLIVAYYGTGLFFILRHWQRTHNRKATFSMIAGLWLLAGWDVDFYYPLYGDYCEKEAKLEYYGPCVDDLDMYDCRKFDIIFPTLDKSVTCPLELERVERGFGGLQIVELRAYDRRCGKLVYEHSYKVVDGNFGMPLFPLFNWVTGGNLTVDHCFGPKGLVEIQSYMKGWSKKK